MGIDTLSYPYSGYTYWTYPCSGLGGGGTEGVMLQYRIDK